MIKRITANIILVTSLYVMCTGVLCGFGISEGHETSKNAVLTGDKTSGDKVIRLEPESLKSMKSGFYEGNNIIQLKPHETKEERALAQCGAIPETRMAPCPEVEHSEQETEHPEAGTIQETGQLEVETAEQTEETTTEEYYPVYSVAGVVLDEDLQRELYIQLQNRGIEWWMPYGLMTAFQESGFNTSAVSQDGRDIGLFQFRSSYWHTSYTSAGLPSADIYNPYDQIYVYADSIEKKLSSGKDVATVISDHYTGGQYYNNWYVSLVLGWESTIYQLK